MKTYSTFAEAYQDLAKRLQEAPEVSVRGLKTKELLCETFRIEDPTKRFELLPEKRELYFYGELLWYLCGTYDVREISPFSKFWLKIAGEDKKVNSNYGHRIFRTERTFFRALSLLKKDIYARQAICHINLPRDVYVGNKDIPCTVFLHFVVRDQRLNMIGFMRSNDFIKGLTYDFPAFSVFQQIMFMLLREDWPDLKLGWYQHWATSLHVYEPDFEKLSQFQTENSYREKSIRLKRLPITSSGRPVREIEELFLKAQKEPERAFEVQEALFS